MSKLKQLSDDYEISVDRMIPLQESTNENFTVIDGVFFSEINGEFINMPILVNEDGWQIFSMKDNTFILEVEDFLEGTVEYFQADNLEDILDTYEV